MLANGVVVTQQFIAAQHQFAKVHHTLALALFFVKLVDLDFFTGLRVFGHDRSRAQSVFFAAADKPLNLFGGPALVVNTKLLVQPLDGRQLVLGVENLKRLRQTRQFVMRAQQPVAQAVKGANPHAAHIHGNMDDRRVIISLAALLVKVTAKTPAGDTSPD
jgi:hypothetical protein